MATIHIDLGKCELQSYMSDKFAVWWIVIKTNLCSLLFCHVLFWKTASIVERAIVKSLEKQYNDILTPLKDSIPKRLNMHVQKLTRRQSSPLYSVPTQVRATDRSCSI